MPLDTDPGTSNYAKYATSNPLMRRVIQRFLQRIVAEVGKIGPAQVIDVGCGEGMVAHELQKLPGKLDYRGFELNPLAVAAARALNPGLSFAQADLFALDLQEQPADLVMMLEVLEHIPDPAQMFPILKKLARNHVLLSVPHEPFFRGLNFMRGQHIKRFGNHPEHINLWGRRAFFEFIEPHFEILASPIVFPWTMVLARPRR